MWTNVVYIDQRRNCNIVMESDQQADPRKIDNKKIGQRSECISMVQPDRAR